jgi:hypothetical protein
VIVTQALHFTKVKRIHFFAKGDSKMNNSMQSISFLKESDLYETVSLHKSARNFFGIYFQEKEI